MKKLKLDLNELKVDSFEISSSLNTHKGTIKGNGPSLAVTEPCDRTDISCQNTCDGDTCNGTCYNTCNVTCPDTCGFNSCQPTGCEPSCQVYCGPTIP